MAIKRPAAAPSQTDPANRVVPGEEPVAHDAGEDGEEHEDLEQERMKQERAQRKLAEQEKGIDDPLVQKTKWMRGVNGLVGKLLDSIDQCKKSTAVPDDIKDRYFARLSEQKTSLQSFRTRIEKCTNPIKLAGLLKQATEMIRLASAESCASLL